MAGRVLLKGVYLLVRRVLSLAVLISRKDLAKDAELLVLRHENAVLRRNAGRVRYEPADRVWFAALARLIPRRRGRSCLSGSLRETQHLRQPTGGSDRYQTSPTISPSWRIRSGRGVAAGSPMCT